MALRRDALAGAAEVDDARSSGSRATSTSGTTVGTVGVLRVRPGAINVVPGEVELDVDVRDSTSPRARPWSTGLLAAAREIAGRARPRGRGRADRRGHAGAVRRRGGRRRRGGLRGARAALPAHDQRRLPRRHDPGRRGAGRDDLRAERRRRSATTPTSTPRPSSSTRACACWPACSRGWLRTRRARRPCRAGTRRAVAGRHERLRAVGRHVDEVVGADLVLVAAEEVGARARRHVEAVLLVVDLDLGEPDAGVEAQQAHVEVVARVDDGSSSSRRREAGHGRVAAERLVVAVAGERLGRGEARPRLVAALEPQHLGRRRARPQAEAGVGRQVGPAAAAAACASRPSARSATSPSRT